MSSALRLVCGCLICACLAACGGSASSGSPRQQITHMFDSIDAAMASGDYATACNYFSSHQQSVIVSGAQRAGLKVSSCSAAMTALFKATGISRAQLAQTFGGGGAPKLHSISIHGNQGTVTYTTDVAGRTITETDAVVRQNGQWKADRIITRSG